MPKQALSDILGWRHSTLKEVLKGSPDPQAQLEAPTRYWRQW